MSADLSRTFPATVIGELASWVEQQRRKGVDGFILQRKEEEVQKAIVCQFTWEDGENDANQLALIMHDRAAEEGRHLRGKSHAYGIFAMRGADQRDRRYITVAGAGEDAPYESRETSGAMIAGQLMQHAHLSVQLALGQTGEIVAHYEHLLADSNSRVEKLEAKLWSLAQAREELETKRHERDMERLQAQYQQNDREFFKERFDRYAPTLLATWAASRAPKKNPASAVPAAMSDAPALADDLVNSLLESLSEEQLMSIAGVLAPEQQAIVHSLYAAYGERELARKKAEAQAKAAATAPDATAH